MVQPNVLVPMKVPPAARKTPYLGTYLLGPGARVRGLVYSRKGQDM